MNYQKYIAVRKQAELENYKSRISNVMPTGNQMGINNGGMMNQPA